MKTENRIKYPLIIIFAIAFAWIESAVVYYLHLQFYPGGFSFPMVEWSVHLVFVEVMREFCTLIVMFTLAWLAHSSAWGRFGWFMLIFGIWDIFYYIWLVVFEGWPESLFTVDLLFLIPAPWAGPVLAPVLVSAGLVVSGIFLLYRLERGLAGPPRKVWALTLAGWLVVLASFLWEAPRIIKTNSAGPFNWWLFGAGMGIWALALSIYLHSTHAPAADK